MRKLLFILFILTNIFACDNNSYLENQIDLTEIRIKERPCEALEYVGKIGNDFNFALDSLKNLKNITSEINKVTLEVLFNHDNRQFYGINYGDDCGMYTDVLDTKGNYFLRTYHCDGDNDVDTPK